MTTVEADVKPELVIIDDNNRANLDTDFLVTIGRHLRIITSLEEAVSALRGVTSDTVIVLDLMFPQSPEDGLDFLRELRRRNVNVPVIVFTNASVDEDRVRALGAVLVHKTGDPDHLRNAIKLACGFEVLSASVLCEVVELNLRKVRVRIVGEHGWIAERELDRDFCPSSTTEVGGAFFLDTYEIRRKGKKEYVVRSRSVDPSDELATVDEWFEDL